jgi:predicted permease
VSFLRVFGSRLIRMFRRQRSDHEMDAEFHSHLEMLAEANMRRGMTREEACRAARREFGGLEQTRESYRDGRSLVFLETLLQDTRLAIRGLAKRPGFTLLAILTLALGIGVNTALFTVVHGVLFRPLPFPHPRQLVAAWERGVGEGDGDNVVAGGQFTDWQQQATSFEQIAVVSEDSANLSGDGGSLPEAIRTGICSHTLFPLLGIQPIYGRPFSAQDDRDGAAATVILSFPLWQRRYGSNPAVVGEKILLDSKPYTIVGVLPSSFDYPNSRVQVWLPVNHEVAPEDMHSRGNHRFFVTARLKNGVSIAQAHNELDAIQQRIHEQFPDTLAGHHARVVSLSESLVGDVKNSLYVLMGAVGCVLLIACLNVANLFVARSATRRKELAVRAALGGSRWRLVREQLTETLLLTFAGGVLGAALAYAGIDSLVAFRENLPRSNSIQVDRTALLFTAAIALFSGIFSGLIPALSATRSRLLEPLQENSRSSSGGQGRARLRRSLLTAEVALTVVLLVGAGLLLKSFAELRSVKIGCATGNVLTMGLTLPEVKYGNPVQKSQFFAELLGRVRAMPGVQSAGFVTVVPGAGHYEDNTFDVEGRPPLPSGQFLDAVVRGADPAYFQAIDIPLVRGRFYRDSDRREHENAMVISESMVREFFPNEDPLGKRLIVHWGGQPRFEIVGVVGDVVSRLTRPPEPTMYFPLNFGRFGYGSLVLRSTKDPTALALPVQQEIARIDRDLAVSDVLTMDQVLGTSTANARFDAGLVLLFALLALLLAAVGLYALLSYLVTQRTGEIGIRIALGAQGSSVMRLVLADGLRPIGAGLVLGLIGGGLSGQLIRAELFGVRPLDFMILTSVTLVVVVVALLASSIPVLRASKCDPMVALRSE